MLTKWGEVLASIRYTTNTPAFNLQNNVFPPVQISQSGIPAFIKVKTIAGNIMYCAPWVNINVGKIITQTLGETGSSALGGVAIGSGNTAPTKNDYTLENQITGITATTPVLTQRNDTESDKYIIDALYTITNNTGAEITINEIGFFGTGYMETVKGTTTRSRSDALYNIMLDRTVLNNAVVIPNTESGIVVYSFEYGTDYE